MAPFAAAGEPLPEVGAHTGQTAPEEQQQLAQLPLRLRQLPLPVLVPQLPQTMPPAAQGAGRYGSIPTSAHPDPASPDAPYKTRPNPSDSASTAARCCGAPPNRDAYFSIPVSYDRSLLKGYKFVTKPIIPHFPGTSRLFCISTIETADFQQEFTQFSNICGNIPYPRGSSAVSPPHRALAANTEPGRRGSMVVPSSVVTRPRPPAPAGSRRRNPRAEPALEEHLRPARRHLTQIQRRRPPNRR